MNGYMELKLVPLVDRLAIESRSEEPLADVMTESLFLQLAVTLHRNRFAADGACEFKSAFANHLPMIVIADALGVPRQDMDRFHRWSDAFVVQLGGVSDRETRLEAARRIVEFQRYFVDKIEEKRAAR